MVPNMAALCVIDVSDDNGLAALNIPFADSGHGSTGDDDSRCEGRKEGRKEGSLLKSEMYQTYFIPWVNECACINTYRLSPLQNLGHETGSPFPILHRRIFLLLFGILHLIQLWKVFDGMLIEKERWKSSPLSKKWSGRKEERDGRAILLGSVSFF